MPAPASLAPNVLNPAGVEEESITHAQQRALKESVRLARGVGAGVLFVY